MSKPALICIVANADGSFCPLSGQYLKDFDPNAFNGRGMLTVTPDPAEAKAFTDNAEAMAYWSQQSTRMPTRPDGQPNKPLTAYSVTIGPPLEEVRRWKDR